MKFRGITLAVTICFTFYSICGCSSAKHTMSDLDKYDSLPFKNTMIVNAGYDAAYKAALISLEKKGYIVTLSDPQTGLANLELVTSNKLPEEEKKAQTEDSGPSAGTVILVVLSVVLIVGLIVLLSNSSDDDSKKEKEDEHKYDPQTRTGRIGGSQTSRISPSSSSAPAERYERHHDDYQYVGPIFNTLLGAVVSPSEPIRSNLYILTLHTTELSDSTTEIQLSTKRMELLNGSATNIENFENKYINYGVFDGIERQLNSR